MSNFFIKIEENETSNRFIEETNARLQDHDLVKNPFYGGLKKVTLNDNTYLNVSITPIWPVTPFRIMGLLFTVGAALFRGLSLWLLPGLIMLSITFLWSELFIYLMLRAGFRKNGYTKSINKVRSKELINILSNIML